ncbi:hypothetical protein SADUNF_Sadunf13G0029400 [Salix dunnii]|uniref:Uncharacterized protein n=1 Tax=Salix dunnii TaxID=1413687 RepID=A0A835JIK2_9ROSI|nr:hypothetical protein SADUNF_Sadunf13G0029400 [Salix dunnii]
MGAGLRSPQEGDPTSKFVVEGAAQAAAPANLVELEPYDCLFYHAQRYLSADESNSLQISCNSYLSAVLTTQDMVSKVYCSDCLGCNFLVKSISTVVIRAVNIIEAMTRYPLFLFFFACKVGLLAILQEMVSELWGLVINEKQSGCKEAEEVALLP